jgi:hypothetical protein
LPATSPIDEGNCTTPPRAKSRLVSPSWSMIMCSGMAGSRWAASSRSSFNIAAYCSGLAQGGSPSLASFCSEGTKSAPSSCFFALSSLKYLNIRVNADSRMPLQ